MVCAVQCKHPPSQLMPHSPLTSIPGRRESKAKRRGTHHLLLPPTIPPTVSSTHPLAIYLATTPPNTTSHPQIHRLVAPRDQKHQSNFVEFRGSSKIVYRRYAGLFFCACVDANDNELAYLEAIHFFVEVLDQFFGNVCELDLVFNFYKVSRARARTYRDGWTAD